jgi:hypothetical protein
VKAGQDDRWARLHEARFLAGAGCSATKLWLSARELIGLNGQPPISTYDMQAVGLAGFVTVRGWCELANLSSPKLSVRMLNINNCAARASSSRTSKDKDDLIDFAEVGEFVVALRAMRLAMAYVMPWNSPFDRNQFLNINFRPAFVILI